LRNPGQTAETAFFKSVFIDLEDSRPKGEDEMELSGLGLSASVWIVPLAVAASGALASAILLRDRLRLGRRAAGLTSEVERLKTEIRELARAGERAQAAPESSCETLRLREAHETAPAGEVWADGDLRRTARTALSGMMGLTSLLLDTPLDRDQDVLVRRVRDLGDQVLACLEGRAGTSAPTVDARADGTGPARVLLVEDNEINALLALKSLEKAGALVEWVRDGKAAITAARESFEGAAPRYDLVLMDLRMPGIDGLEAARRIRSMEEALVRPEPLRIVALTATTMRQDRLAAQAAGIDEFISKPYRAEVLAGLLAPAPRQVLAAS
jgi:CheY-like chemotaxis protein